MKFKKIWESGNWRYDGERQNYGTIEGIPVIEAALSSKGMGICSAGINGGKIEVDTNGRSGRLYYTPADDEAEVYVNILTATKQAAHGDETWGAIYWALLWGEEVVA